jgi:hypothetical protein
MLALRALATQAARRVVDAMDESAHNPLVRKVLSPVPIIQGAAHVEAQKVRRTLVDV